MLHRGERTPQTGGLASPPWFSRAGRVELYAEEAWNHHVFRIDGQLVPAPRGQVFLHVLDIVPLGFGPDPLYRLSVALALKRRRTYCSRVSNQVAFVHQVTVGAREE